MVSPLESMTVYVGTPKLTRRSTVVLPTHWLLLFMSVLGVADVVFALVMASAPAVTAITQENATMIIAARKNRFIMQ
jgi:hypothetical protein